MRRLTLFVLLGSLLTGSLAALDYGMSREQVIQELGKPTADVVHGSRQVLSYPKNVRIELVDGKVSVIKGLEVVDGVFRLPGAAKAAAPAGPVETAEQKAARVAEEQAAAVEQAARERAEAELQRQADAERAKQTAEMEKAIGQLEAAHDRSAEPPAAPSFDVLAFGLELVVKWLMMLAALKLTCKFWGYDVFWSSLLIAAAADTATRVAVGLVGHHLLGMFTLFYCDEAVAALVLFVVLKKVSINQSTAFAAQVTVTSKVFSVVVGSLLVTVLLQALR